MIWKKRRRNAYSHISRLPYDNPARIVLFGHRNEVQNVKKRRFYNVKRTMMKDIRDMNVGTYCNLCDRKYVRLSTFEIIVIKILMLAPATNLSF